MEQQKTGNEELHNSRLWSVDEAATFLRVPIWSVYQLVRQKQLPHVRVGRRRIRFDEAALREYVRSGGSAQAA